MTASAQQTVKAVTVQVGVIGTVSGGAVGGQLRGQTLQDVNQLPGGVLIEYLGLFHLNTIMNQNIDEGMNT